MSEKKVRMVAVFILHTDDPKFWNGLGEHVKDLYPERADDVEVFRVENFGIPMYKIEDEPITIEVEEREIKPKEG